MMDSANNSSLGTLRRSLIWINALVDKSYGFSFNGSIGHSRVDGGERNCFESATLVGHATIPAARSGDYFEIARTGIQQHAPTPSLVNVK
jgi:hypothetical protein